MDRKKITKKVSLGIVKRSNKCCECCGIDIKVDKHHILEFFKGGPDTIENLLALCPNCHRQIPKYLDISQQKEIQEEWSIMLKNSITHNIKTNLNHFKIGSNTYIDNKSILRINGQSIFIPVEKDGRYYVNIIMLEGFEPQLLVLTNHVVVGGNIEIISEYNHLRVLKGSDIIYEIFKKGDNTPPTINMKFKFKDVPIIATENETQIPGLLLKNSIIRGSVSAINLNL